MSMIEEAIVDAKALKEVALKNAESLVIEKFSNKIKEAVENILEQEDDDLDLGMEDETGLPADLGMGGEMDSGMEGSSDILDQVPLGGAEGEVCCPDEDEEIEIDFGELEQALEMDEEEPTPDEMLDREEIADEIAAEEEPQGLPVVENLEEEQVEEGCDKPHKRDDDTLDEDIELDEETLEQIAEGEIDLEEDDKVEENIEQVEEKEELEEEVSFDQENVPTGYSGATSAQKEEAQDVALAKATNDDDTKEEIEALKKTQKSLQESLSQTRKENKQLKSLLNSAKQKINETHLMNAKLTYKNKVLQDVSLNERQRKQIAESISGAKSVEEAKTIYETVSSVVGQVRKNRPKSLREAVNRNASTPFARSKEDNRSNPAFERMKVLAGIKKNN